MPHLFMLMGSKSGYLKHCIVPTLLRLAEESPVSEYREPFAGTAQIGVSMMSYCPYMRHRWNDYDACIASLWLTVRDQPDELVQRVTGFVPTVDLFREFHAELRRAAKERVFNDTVDLGFKRLAMAYLYHHGIGSGCRGGFAQLYGQIDERWRPERLVEKIRFHHARLSRVGVQIDCWDFQALIDDSSEPALLYLDPPYKGFLNYYGRSFTDEDHERLADVLGRTQHHWVLSYGEHPEIRRLYRWARIDEIGHENLLICRR
jgi:DNA adenine methylase